MNRPERHHFRCHELPKLRAAVGTGRTFSIVDHFSVSGVSLPVCRFFRVLRLAIKKHEIKFYFSVGLAQFANRK